MLLSLLLQSSSYLMLVFVLVALEECETVATNNGQNGDCKRKVKGGQRLEACFANLYFKRNLLFLLIFSHLAS